MQIGRIKKNKVTEIHVDLTTEGKYTGLNIREWLDTETYTGPTKKGLIIPLDKLESFKKMVDKATKKAGG